MESSYTVRSAVRRQSADERILSLHFTACIVSGLGCNQHFNHLTSVSRRRIHGDISAPMVGEPPSVYCRCNSLHGQRVPDREAAVSTDDPDGSVLASPFRSSG